MTANHRSDAARDNISAAVKAWWQRKRAADPSVEERSRRIVDLHAAGMPNKAIAREIGVSPQRVCQILKAIVRRGRT